MERSQFFSVESLGVKLSFTIHVFFRTAVLRQIFDIRFSYKHCNFSRVCLAIRQDGVENRDKVYCVYTFLKGEIEDLTVT